MGSFAILLTGIGTALSNSRRIFPLFRHCEAAHCIAQVIDEFRSSQIDFVANILTMIYSSFVFCFYCVSYCFNKRSGCITTILKHFQASIITECC